MNHLMSSSYHELPEDEARSLASRAPMDTWGTSKEHQHTAKAEHTQPKKKARAAIADASSDGQAASSSSALLPAASTRQRAEDAEAHVAYIGAIMTRVVEQLTRSAASCKTAARFARQAAEAFDTEHHAIQSSLDTIQAMYATTSTS